MDMRTFLVNSSVLQCRVTSVNLVVALAHDNVRPSFAMAVRAILDHLTLHVSVNSLAKIMMADSGAVGNLTIAKSMLSSS